MKQQERQVYQERYRRFYMDGPDWLCCFYCGEPADTWDHQPPISRVDDFSALHLQREDYIQVRCCRDCNGMLGDELTASLFERKELQKAKIAKRYKKDMKVADLWADRQVKKLGKNLSSAVKRSIRRGTKAWDRHDYTHGIQCYADNVDLTPMDILSEIESDD